MKQTKSWLFGAGAVLVLFVVGGLIVRNTRTDVNTEPEPSSEVQESLFVERDDVLEEEVATDRIDEIESESNAEDAPVLRFPVVGFTDRISKKPFGIFIDEATSPVQPERFSGYHTGADIEFTDVTDVVPVYAIADGTIVASQTVNGYGGVIILNFTHNDQKLAALYGHLQPSSLAPKGPVKAGDQIGQLGEGFTKETDGERKHLHFAILNSQRLDFRGYVSSESELSDWLNPLDVLIETIQAETNR